MFERLRIACWVGVGVWVCGVSQPVAAAGAADAAAVPLHHGCSVRFAPRTKGQEILAREDTYLQSIGRFDREIRLRAVDVTPQQHIDFIREQVREWDAAEQQHVTTALEAVRQRLGPWQLPLPETIWLVRTTGQEESGAAYCRQNAIALPQRMVRLAVPQLERLLLHELFHVLSNQNPALRRQMYALVGFEVIEPVVLPAPLHDRKITNPDAPQVDCYLWISHEGEVLPAGPLLLSKAPFTADERRSMFEMLEFRLVALDLDPAAARATVRLLDGQPILIDPDQASYYWNVGLNTSYLIHPDEILADNFVHLMRGKANLPTPRIVLQLGELLSAQP